MTAAHASQRRIPKAMGAGAFAVLGAIATFLLLLMLSSGRPGPSMEATVLHVGAHSMTYCVQDGQPLEMTIFEPASRHGTVPAVVEVHGGGWVQGSRLRSLLGSPIARALVARGLVVASIDYRMAPRFRWPAEIEDLACAVRSLRAHHRMLGVDPTRIGLWGASAGGQLVSLLGTSPDHSSWTVGPYGSESDRVQAVVDEFGPVDLTVGGWNSYLEGLVEEAFAVPAGQPNPVLEQASPALQVRSGDPPFLIVQGTADWIVPPSQSEELADRLEAARVPTKLVLVRGGSHGLGTPGECPPPARIDQDVVHFLVTTLESHRPLPRSLTRDQHPYARRGLARVRDRTAR